MAFQDVVKRIYAKNHRGTKFGEQVVFTPIDGGPAHRIRVSIKPLTRNPVNGTTQDKREEFSVAIGTDPTDEDTGGVTVLRVKDQILRCSDRDPSQVPIIFSGEILEDLEHQRLAVFHRVKRVNQGREQ